MRVKNEYVQIKKGNKVYTKQNMILDKYINRLFSSQINPTYSTPPIINSCYLKLDTPLENIDYSSNLTFSDFDIKLFTNIFTEYSFQKMSTRTKDKVSINYKFTSDGIFQYGNSYYGTMNDFNMFNGRKVTAIGFGYINTCYAVVDVSSMNIIINTDEEFSVSRSDTYQSDAICSGIDFPLHLVNFNAYYDYNANTGEQTVAQLYSIGLGNVDGLMESEHIIDFEETEIEDNNITIEFNELIKVGHYPSESLQLGFYPTKDISKRLILKYRLLRIDSDDNKTLLDEYYTMSYNINLTRYDNYEKNISFNLKLERM